MAQLIGAHHLQIGLHRAAADVGNAFLIVQSLPYFFDQGIQRPLPKLVGQAGIDGAVTDQGIAVGGHELIIGGKEYTQVYKPKFSDF